MQNRYPAALDPLGMRNAADLSAASAQRPLGGWQGRERLAGLEASSVHWTLWQCRERFNCVFAMRNQTQKPPCATPPRTCPPRVLAATALVVGRCQKSDLVPAPRPPRFPFLVWHRDCAEVTFGRLGSAKVPPRGKKAEARSRGLEAFSGFVPPGGKMAERR
jgi:hypothetical protein